MIGLTQKLTLKGDRVNTEHDTEAEGQAKQHLYLYDHDNKKSAHRGTEIFRASAIAIWQKIRPRERVYPYDIIVHNGGLEQY